MLTGVARGKNDMIKTRIKYKIEVMLIASPYRLGSFHFEGGRGSPRSFLMVMHDIDIIYDDIRATTPRDAIASNAKVEPMLISERRTAMMNERATALRGKSQPGLTWVH